MYYLNKIVGWILSPMGIVMIGSFACAVCARMNRWRMAWACGIASFATLWIFGSAVTTRIIGRPLECGYDREGAAHGDVSWAPKGDAC